MANGDIVGKGWYVLQNLHTGEIEHVMESYKLLNLWARDVIGFTLEELVKTEKWIVFIVDLVESGE